MNRLWVVLLFIGSMTVGKIHAEDALPVFDLDAKDVGKVVLLMFKPDRFVLEVTYSKEKQAELAKLTGTDLPRKIQIVLDGKMVSERSFTEPSTGHSLKFDMASMEDAFGMARALWKQGPSTEKAAP